MHAAVEIMADLESGWVAKHQDLLSYDSLFMHLPS